ncbi:sodium/glutamate symporter [Peptoniphilus raoultii]|uniref:sodium/glutamate symporter n=1 Tax=Peptoniphilus raoultii TaxID=1776387 RepID=UPI0008D8F989|nr:sodium/glutamate symporter [Peptoniphilus raoultii]
MNLENAMKYFGTYTQANSGGVGTFKFEYLTSLGFAALVIIIGRFIVSKSKLLQKYAIPAPVVSGMIFSIIVALIKTLGIIEIQFDVDITKDLAQNIFFLTVGYGFSMSLIHHAGGKLMARIAIGACLIITLQNIVGLALAKVINLDPFLALQCSSAGMSGGVGTAAAMGEVFRGMGAPANVSEVGIAAGTLGNVMGSLIGGPVAAYLISRHNLKSDPNDKPESQKDGFIQELDEVKMVKAFALALLIGALGMPIYFILDNIPAIEMPKFIGCLFAGCIARNFLEARDMKTYVPEMSAIESMFLELYLALVLMTIDITKLVPVAGKMGIILLGQAILVTIFAIYVSYNLFGKDYGAAVMASGNCGWACGSGPNAVANIKACMDTYGYHHIAWVIYPSFAVLIDDIYNPILLSVIANFIK